MWCCRFCYFLSCPDGGIGGGSTYAASCGNVPVQGPEICFPKHASCDFTQHCLAQHPASCFLEIFMWEKDKPRTPSPSRFVLFRLLFFFNALRSPPCWCRCGLSKRTEYDPGFKDAGLWFRPSFSYSNANAVNASDGVEKPAGGDPLTESQALVSLDFIRLPGRLEKDVTSDPPGAAPSVHSQNAEGNTAQWWPCHLPGAFGKEGWYEARVLEQKELWQHEMAHKVVCFVTKYALLLRERVQLSTLGIIPVGGMHMRQGAFAEALTVSQGVLGEAGMECVRANTHCRPRSLFSPPVPPSRPHRSC